MDNTGLHKQLEILGVETINTIRKILAEENKYATGKLIQSLDFKVIKDVNGFLLQILAVDYFKYVDGGRRPGKFPPIKPIKSWLQIKGIVTDQKKLSGVAFAVARSIKEKGIKPVNAKKRALDEVMKNKEKILKKGIVKDIEEILDKMFITERK